MDRKEYQKQYQREYRAEGFRKIVDKAYYERHKEDIKRRAREYQRAHYVSKKLSQSICVDEKNIVPLQPK